MDESLVFVQEIPRRSPRERTIRIQERDNHSTHVTRKACRSSARLNQRSNSSETQNRAQNIYIGNSRLYGELPNPVAIIDLTGGESDKCRQNKQSSRRSSSLNAREDRKQEKAIVLECPICLESLTNRRIRVTECGHLFCEDCLNMLMTTQNAPLCPKCRSKLIKGLSLPVYL